MKYLLDTQAFLLILSQSSQVGSRAKKVVLDHHSEVFLSVASVWEMVIKISIGKLKLKASLQTMVQSAVTTGGFQILPIQVEHLMGLESLPFHHRDPFDRLLVCQARLEKMAIIGSDRSFDRYEIKRVW